MTIISICLHACGGGGAQTQKTPATAAEKKAGAAKGFVEADADNSIPTYGSESSTSERVAAERDLRAYLDARADGNWRRACEGLGPSVRRQLQGLDSHGAGCAATYRALSSAMAASARESLLRGPIVSMRVKGRTGFLLFYGPKRQKYVMPMTLEGGAWKVTQIAPVAYPLGSEAVQP